MKSFVVLAALVASALGSIVPSKLNVKNVDKEFIARQEKILELLEHVEQANYEAEYYKVGKDYDIQEHLDKYQNKEYVQEFLNYFTEGFIPKQWVATIYEEGIENEIVTMYNLLNTAVDFDTFYKTAAFMRVHLNEIEFVNAIYLAIIHNKEYHGLVLPALFETVPKLFVNSDLVYKGFLAQMNGELDPAFGEILGSSLENGHYIHFSNYSNLAYPGQEQRLAYFTEDVGLNSYYAYYSMCDPVWKENVSPSIAFERRGELYISFYKQLLARYYLERLSNGLGEIPEFSWRVPLQIGYYPDMYYGRSFIQRPVSYDMNIEKNSKYLQFLETYEQIFLSWLNFGYANLNGESVELKDPKSMNLVGNYWRGSADLFGKLPSRGYSNMTYETLARFVLSGTPVEYNKHNIMASSLAFPETSLRDPVSFQLFNRIWNYISMYLDYLPSYTADQLRFPGIKIKDVKIDKLVTFFDFYEFDMTNAIYLRKNEFETTPRHIVRQPRLNHKPFSVEIDVKSDVESEAVVKIFLGPKYDSNGNVLSLEENWMNFVKLDWFTYKLSKGENKIERLSDDFFYYKQDSIPTYELDKLLKQGQVPVDMSEEWYKLPNRMMLPKGTSGGFPYQMFVVVYPFEGLPKNYENFKYLLVDAKPFGYPLDRPAYDSMFMQPNMYMEDVKIYQEGSPLAYELNTPYYQNQLNVVSKN